MNAAHRQTARDLGTTAVAWRCKDYADGWIVFQRIDQAQEYQDQTGCLMQPLFTLNPPTDKH